MLTLVELFSRAASQGQGSGQELTGSDRDFVSTLDLVATSTCSLLGYVVCCEVDVGWSWDGCN